ncbi:hypothetical protein [Ruania rhizosphaerae]|uniref:hypothetical protein n=1 Tax=Ruania rhizosphaerae TaxID=1840413 RepID=UPI00135756DE|nr:hypothetical protein [Ruania rhizosphaerae]
MNTNTQRPKDPTMMLIFSPIALVLGILLIVIGEDAQLVTLLGVFLVLASIIWGVRGLLRLRKVHQWAQERRS